MSRATARAGEQRPRLRVAPEGAYSDGADAIAIADAYGIHLDEWQQLVVSDWLVRDSEDHLIATRCGLNVPRQNGKTECLVVRVLFGLIVLGERILWTAHESKTATKAFNRLLGFFDDERRYPTLYHMVKTYGTRRVGIKTALGREAIVLANGGSVEFVARTRSSGRGFEGISLIVIDEAQEYTDEQSDALEPTVAASATGERQIIYCGTPPSETTPGEIFPRIHHEAFSESPGPDLCFHDWGITRLEELTDLGDDWDRVAELVYRTNPAVGRRIDISFIETQWHNKTPDGFAREYLSWFVDGGRTITPVIRQRDWAETVSEPPRRTKTEKVTYGVKFSRDGSWVAIAACVRRRPTKANRSPKPYVELAAYKNTSAGVSWIADAIARNQHKVALTMISGLAQADALVDKLAERKVPPACYSREATRDAIAAAQTFVNDVREHAVSHADQGALDDSAATTEKRDIGNYGGYGFQGECPEPVEACALALYAMKCTKRDPSRKMRIL